MDSMERAVGRIEGQLGTVVKVVAEMNDRQKKHIEKMDWRVGKVEGWQARANGGFKVALFGVPLIGTLAASVWSYITK